jgi:hypothetical protein
MIPAHAATHPEDAATRNAEVVERVRSAALSQVERDQRSKSDRPEPQRERALVRNGREVDRRDRRRDEHDGQQTAEVVDRVGCLVHVARHEQQRQDERYARQRQGDEKDGAPPEMLEQRSREQGPKRGDCAADSRPERDRLRARGPGPQGGDQGQRRRVGHPGGEAAEETREEQHRVRRRVGREQRRRNGNRRSQEQHQLASVPIPDRAEVQNRGGQAERVPDGDEIEPCLRGVEFLGNRRQGDVGNRQIEVCHGRDEDEGD